MSGYLPFDHLPADAARARLLARGWDWNTLVAGGSAGIATLPVVGAFAHVASLDSMDVTLGLLFGLVVALCYAVVATAVGSIVIIAIGVPTAALVWTVLRPVRARWVHVLVFAILGGALVVVPTTGGDVLELLVSPVPDLARGLASPGLHERLSTLAGLLALAPYGIVSAAVARVVAELWAARTVRRYERVAASRAFDVTARW